MSVTFTTSLSGYLQPSDFNYAVTGQPLKWAYGENAVSGTKVFSAWNTFEEVPGTLRASILAAPGQKVIIQAKLFWGGVNTTTSDVAANFRIMKSGNGGSTWTSVGTYATDAGLGQQAAIGVATGSYLYNHGDTNASSIQDNILMVDENVTSTSTVIYAVHWACGYSPNNRTLYWNRTINTLNSYNSTHLNTISLMSIK